MPRFRIASASLLAVVLSALLASSGASHAADDEIGRHRWRSPTGALRLVEAYAAPADRYGAGHRGVDLAVSSGAVLRAPEAGVVAFAGKVVDRVVITLDHGEGYVSTLEPVDQPLQAGTPVGAGDEVARAGIGGHAAPGTVHFGVRLRGEYVNPLQMIGGGLRAVLLPCC